MSEDRTPRSPFPTIRSLLSPTALARKIGAAYGLDRAVCRLIKATSRDVYRVDASQGARVLIVYPHGRRTADEIDAELNLLDHLDAHGVAVAPALRTLTGERLVELSAPEGIRYAVLCRFVEGVQLRHSASSYATRRYGRLTARVHTLADGWLDEQGGIDARPALDAGLLIDRSLALVEPLVRHLPDRLAELRRAAELLRQHVAALPRETPGYGVIHGDIIPTNVLVRPDGELTLLDFDFFGRGWRSFDVATFLRDAQTRQTPDEPARAFLAGYQEERALADWELAALPLFVAVRGLFRLGNWGRRVDEWGTSVLPDDLIERQIAAIRDDTARLC